CEVAIILVVDAAQIDDVLFGPGGAITALPAGGIVMVASTSDPDSGAPLAPRIAAAGGALVDAPVSGGPRRAADGAMTMMIAGEAAGPARWHGLLGANPGQGFP